jgi:hypothetical protein
VLPSVTSSRARDGSAASAGGLRQITAKRKRKEGGFRSYRRPAAAVELASGWPPPSAHQWRRRSRAVEVIAAHRASMEVPAMELATGWVPLQSTHQGRSPPPTSARRSPLTSGWKHGRDGKSGGRRDACLSSSSPHTSSDFFILC